MRLSEHFSKTIKDQQLIENKEVIAEVKQRVEQYEPIFVDGIGEDVLEIHPDGSISYYGEIEFNPQSYVDITKKIPFKFKKVNRFVLMNGYAKKLDSLEGCPSVCHTFILELDIHKPPEYFEGHLPKQVTVADISAHSFENFKFGIDQILDKLEITVNEEGSIGSFDGLPREIPKVVFNNTPEVIKTFKGFPEKVQFLAFYSYGGKFGVKDLTKFAKEIHVIVSTQPELEENTPILSLFKLKNLSLMRNDNMLVLSCKEVFKIINRYLDNMDMFGCQEELIDSGYEQFAKAK